MFPPDIVYKGTNFLNDVSLDVTDPENVFAYITDADDPAIIVYDFNNDRSWRAEHPSMEIDPDVGSREITLLF